MAVAMTNLQALLRNPPAFAHQKLVPLSGHPDVRVSQTIGAMTAFAEDAGRYSPAVLQVAGAMARSCGQLDRACQVQRLYDWLSKSVRFKGDPLDLEHLRHPDQLIAEIETHGMAAADCDCLAMLGAAVLIALGIPAWFIVDGLSPIGPLEHVYIAAELSGQLVPLDPQHSTPIGVWPQAGRRSKWPVKEPKR